jgi:hypothetical protein
MCDPGGRIPRVTTHAPQTCDPSARRAWRQRLSDRLAGGTPTEAPQALALRPPSIEAGCAVSLGRSPDCDYVVRSSAVSARHAELRRAADGWTLRDLGSRNGTRVNGWLVREQRLADGDEVTFGDATFVFREPATTA